MEDFRPKNSEALDRVDSKAAGTGDLEAGVKLFGDGDALSLAGYLDYEHRITEDVSAYANGELGYLPMGNDIYGLAQAGLRVRF